MKKTLIILAGAYMLLTFRKAGSEKFDPIFKQAEVEHGVPWTLLKAFADVESSMGTALKGDWSNSKNRHLSIGIMQIHENTAQVLVQRGIFDSLDDRWNSTKNINAGAYLLAEWKNKGYPWIQCISKYNAGSRNMIGMDGKRSSSGVEFSNLLYVTDIYARWRYFGAQDAVTFAQGQ